MLKQALGFVVIVSYIEISELDESIKFTTVKSHTHTQKTLETIRRQLKCIFPKQEARGLKDDFVYDFV